MVKRAVQAGNISEGTAAAAVRHAAGDLLALCTGVLATGGRVAGADGNGRGDDDGDDGLHGCGN